MNDLISKSALIDALKVHFDSCFREDGELLYSDHICTSDDVVDLINLVENQPNAYNVDKVVEELEQLADESYKAFCIAFNSDDRAEYDAYTNAIEIVKQGGVSDVPDNMCEWKYNNSEYYWESSCEHLHIFMSDGPEENEYKFCPYCGKKIKVVE